MNTTSSRRAFSLIELVVVIAIIAIVAAFAVPAVGDIMKGSKLTQASQMLVDQFTLARQSALSRNRSIEVRFYRFGDPEVPGEDMTKPLTGQFRAIQAFEIIESGAALPISRVEMLPVGIIMAANTTSPTETLSTLLDAQPQTQAVNDPTAPPLPRGIKLNYEWVSFRYLSDGSTNLTPASSWYVTLHGLTDKPTSAGSSSGGTSGGGVTPPANFFTLQIDPVSGATKTFRPTAG